MHLVSFSHTMSLRASLYIRAKVLKRRGQVSSIVLFPTLRSLMMILKR